MGIFYQEEHATCYDYQTPTMSTFRVFRTNDSDNQIVSTDVKESVILFVTSGKIRITCDAFQDQIIRGGEMILLPKNSCFYGKSLEDSVIVSCTFIHSVKFCNKYSLKHLSDVLDKDMVYNFATLHIHERIQEFLDFLLKCMADGMGCAHFHNWKQQELFILLRAYYQKNDLAEFFFPVIGADLDFKDFIFTHYLNISNVNEFAELAHLTPATFNRRFKAAFKQPAHKWFADRKAERILRDIKISDKTFEEISIEQGLSSPAYLTTFCKQHFGKAPSELRSEGIASCTEF